MAVITLDIPNQYADELGYQSVVINPDYVPAVYDFINNIEITPAVGEPTIPNPETKGNFLRRVVPKLVVEKLADKAVKVLERTKADETKTESDLLRSTIEAAITVT